MIRLSSAVLVLALVAGAGCSAAQLAADEAVARAALAKVEAGVDWATANPAVVGSLLDDAASVSSDPAFQKAIAKGKAALDAGDLVKAKTFLQVGQALLAPAAAAPSGK